MVEELNIRRLKKDDYLDVFELEKQVHKIHYSHRPDLYNDEKSLPPKDDFDSIIDNPNSIAIGIENNNKIIAIILSEIKETSDNSIMKKRRYCFIDDLVVDSNFRRRGYARALFNELKKELAKFDISDVELTVWPFNKEAVAFYESVGMTAKNIKYEFKINNDTNIEKLEIKTTQNTK